MRRRQRQACSCLVSGGAPPPPHRTDAPTPPSPTPAPPSAIPRSRGESQWLNYGLLQCQEGRPSPSGIGLGGAQIVGQGQAQWQQKWERWGRGEGSWWGNEAVFECEIQDGLVGISRIHASQIFTLRSGWCMMLLDCKEHRRTRLVFELLINEFSFYYVLSHIEDLVFKLFIWLIEID